MTSSWSGCLWKSWPLPGARLTLITVRSFAPVVGGLLSQRSRPQSSTSSPVSPAITNLPPIGRSSLFRREGDRLEALRLLRQRGLHRQPLHAGGAVEAVAGFAILQDVFRVRRHGDRPAVAEHDHVPADGERGVGDGVDLEHALL